MRSLEWLADRGRVRNRASQPAQEQSAPQSDSSESSPSEGFEESVEIPSVPPIS
jgi:hypothetical protein